MKDHYKEKEFLEEWNEAQKYGYTTSYDYPPTYIHSIVYELANCNNTRQVSKILDRTPHAGLCYLSSIIYKNTKNRGPNQELTSFFNHIEKKRPGIIRDIKFYFGSEKKIRELHKNPNIIYRGCKALKSMGVLSKICSFEIENSAEKEGNPMQVEETVQTQELNLEEEPQQQEEQAKEEKKRTVNTETLSSLTPESAQTEETESACDCSSSPTEKVTDVIDVEEKTPTPEPVSCFTPPSSETLIRVASERKETPLPPTAEEVEK